MTELTPDQQHQPTRLKPRQHTITPKRVVAALGIAMLWGGLLTALVLVRTGQDIRQEASTGTPKVQLQLKATEGSQVNWSANPLSIGKDRVVSVVVEAQPDQLNVTAMDLTLKYNPEFLEFVEVKPWNEKYGVLLKREANPSAGTVRIALGRTPTETLTGTHIVTLLTFKTKNKVGESTISLQNTSQVAVLSQDTNAYAGASQPLTVTVIDQSTTTPTTSVQMSFKLAGVPVENRAATLKDAAKTQQFSLTFQSIEGKPGVDAVTVPGQFVPHPTDPQQHVFKFTQPWTSTTLQTGKYQVLLKGPKHQQIRFCKDKQSADHRCSLTDALAITAGREYTFDFTLRPLSCGDLPISGSSKNTQDGRVNVQDYSYMLSCLSKRTDGTCVAKADCNGDGVITNLDMDLLLKTLSTAYDE